MDGVIVINKEKGITSFGVVSAVRKIFNTKKVGHCGTLDPNATGVLPVMIGAGTKLSKYLIEHDKEYAAVLKFGIKTDTADCEGNVIEEDSFRLDSNNEEFYRNKVQEMVGVQKQLPPMYSAIKVNGKKLYEYAREGKEVERAEREVEIYSIEIVKFDYEENEMTFRVSCSKGTYIRTLCETIAMAFGTVGFMKELVRTKVDSFTIEDSAKISELENCSDKEKYVISIEKIFENFGKIELDERKIGLFLNGVRLTEKLNDGVYRIYCGSEFVGLGVVEDGLLKRDVVI